MSNHSLFRPLGRPASMGGGLRRTADIDPRLTRTHYFDGRLLTAEDLTRDQLYLDQRLREVGEVLGDGIVEGLQTNLDRSDFALSIQPGVGITADGRVVTLTRTLTVELGDRAAIAGLNGGTHRRFERGLYAVVLRYVEEGADLAEVFPRDLGAERALQHDVVVEKVVPELVPLAQPLPQQPELIVRARLAREFTNTTAGIVPEDAVALGVLAVSEDIPRWLDSELLRHPPRSELEGHGGDLSRHYESLFADVIATRRAASLGADFAAAEYFQLLPPAGILPKAAVDPAGGQQRYFPESFQVSITPIRQADLELVRDESLALPPIDLSADHDIEVMILAPLAAGEYGHYARQLEREFDASVRTLPHPDPLRLRLYPRPSVHSIDTDEALWRSLWEHVGDELTYVRRPVRPAETAVSGIVLARGTELPEPSDDGGGETPSDGDDLAVDEDEVLLNRVNLELLARLRPPPREEGRQALESLRSAIAQNADAVMNCLALLLRIERHFDAVVWQTLGVLVEGGNLHAFLEQLIQAQEQGAGTAEAVARLGPQLGLGRALVDTWRELGAG